MAIIGSLTEKTEQIVVVVAGRCLVEWLARSSGERAIVFSCVEPSASSRLFGMQIFHLELKLFPRAYQTMVFSRSHPIPKPRSL